MREAIELTTASMFANSGRPRKACGTCKSQKIRCSGERPVCKRCVRLGHPCIYSNNSFPARQSTRESLPACHDGYPSPAPTAALDSNSRIRPTRSDHLTSCPRVPLNGDYPGVPKAMVSILVHVYWDNLYNASLLLNKRVFFEALETGTVRPHIILSICASAAKYADAPSHLKMFH